ncbi:Hpt domain-containing protein [Propionivibrio limicola]|uniref:Hpt domain-containing protein n=1 Tax=Propionivibrio limicola TaxID=167645 RepID=UPI0012914B6F|nr:Hpt domain-containing protein [Propionivibrio limicola]
MTNGVALYDRGEAIAQLGGDETLFNEMAMVFQEEKASYCQALQEALAVSDTATLQREAHTVKSVFAALACETGRRVAFELEQLAATGELAGADRLTDIVVDTLDRLAGELGG